MTEAIRKFCEAMEKASEESAEDFCHMLRGIRDARVGRSLGFKRLANATVRAVKRSQREKAARRGESAE